MTSSLRIPSTLQQVLCPHQIEALHFLWRHLLEQRLLRATTRPQRGISGAAQTESDDELCGCILAHPTGLGKTFTTLSFLLLLQAHLLLLTLRREQQSNEGLRRTGQSMLQRIREPQEDDSLPACRSLRVLVLCPGSCVAHWRNSATDGVREDLFGRQLCSALPVYTPALCGASVKQIEDVLVHGFYRHGGLLVLSYLDYVKLLRRVGGAGAIAMPAAKKATAITVNSASSLPSSSIATADAEKAAGTARDGVSGSLYTRVRSILDGLGTARASVQTANRTAQLLDVLRCADVLVLDEAHRLRRVRARWLEMLKRHVSHVPLRIALTRIAFSARARYREAYFAMYTMMSMRMARAATATNRMLPACDESSDTIVHAVSERVSAQLLPPRQEYVIYTRLSAPQETRYRDELRRLPRAKHNNTEDYVWDGCAHMGSTGSLGDGSETHHGSAQTRMLERHGERDGTWDGGECVPPDTILPVWVCSRSLRRLAHLYLHPDLVPHTQSRGHGHDSVKRQRGRRESPRRKRGRRGGAVSTAASIRLNSGAVALDATAEAALIEDDDNVIQDGDEERRQGCVDEEDEDDVKAGKEDNNIDPSTSDPVRSLSSSSSSGGGNSGSSSSSNSSNSSCSSGSDGGRYSDRSLSSDAVRHESDTDSACSSPRRECRSASRCPTLHARRVTSAMPLPARRCARQHTTRYDADSSPKLQVALHLIRHIADELLEKVVVLSQHVSHLALLALLLKQKHGIRARVIECPSQHGNTIHDEQNTDTRKGEVCEDATMGNVAAAEEFAQSAQRPVLLCVTRAVGSGLQLTAASHCILLDVASGTYERAAEAHAMERVVRLGQVRSVTVYRLIAHGTMEQAMWTHMVRVAKRKETKSTDTSREGRRGGGVSSSQDARPATSSYTHDDEQQRRQSIDAPPTPDGADDNTNDKDDTGSCIPSAAQLASSALCPVWGELLSRKPTLHRLVAVVAKVSHSTAEHTGGGSGTQRDEDRARAPSHPLGETTRQHGRRWAVCPTHTDEATMGTVVGTTSGGGHEDADAATTACATSPIACVQQSGDVFSAGGVACTEEASTDALARDSCTHAAHSAQTHSTNKAMPSGITAARNETNVAAGTNPAVAQLSRCEPALREAIGQAGDHVILHAIQRRDAAMGESLRMQDTVAMVQETEAMLVRLLQPLLDDGVHRALCSTSLAEVLLVCYQRGVRIVMAHTLDTAPYVKLRVYLSSRVPQGANHGNDGTTDANNSAYSAMDARRAHSLHAHQRRHAGGTSGHSAQTSTTRTHHVLTEALLFRPYALLQTIRPKEQTMVCTELGATRAWVPHCLLVGVAHAIAHEHANAKNDSTRASAAFDDQSDCANAGRVRGVYSGAYSTGEDGVHTGVPSTHGGGGGGGGGGSSRGKACQKSRDGTTSDVAPCEENDERAVLKHLSNVLFGVSDRHFVVSALHDCLRQRWPHGAGLTLPPLPVSRLGAEERLMREVYAATAMDAATAVRADATCSHTSSHCGRALDSTADRRYHSSAKHHGNIDTSNPSSECADEANDEGGGGGVFDGEEVAALLQLPVHPGQREFLPQPEQQSSQLHGAHNPNLRHNASREQLPRQSWNEPRFGCPRCRNTFLQRTAAWALQCGQCHYNAEFELLHHPLRHHHALLYQLGAVTGLLRQASVHRIGVVCAFLSQDEQQEERQRRWSQDRRQSMGHTAPKLGGVCAVLRMLREPSSAAAAASVRETMTRRTSNSMTLPQRSVEVGVASLLQLRPEEEQQQDVERSGHCVTAERSREAFASTGGMLTWIHALRLQCGVSVENMERLRRLLCANSGVVWGRRLRPHLRAALLHHFRASLAGASSASASYASPPPLTKVGATMANTCVAPPSQSMKPSSLPTSEFAGMAASASAMPMMNVVMGLHTMMVRASVHFAHDLLSDSEALLPHEAGEQEDETPRAAVRDRLGDTDAKEKEAKEALVRMREVADGVVMLRYVRRIQQYAQRRNSACAHDSSGASSTSARSSSTPSIASASCRSSLSASSSPSVNSVADPLTFPPHAHLLSSSSSSSHSPYAASSASLASVSSSVRPKSMSSSDATDRDEQHSIDCARSQRQEQNSMNVVAHLKDVRTAQTSSSSSLSGRSSPSLALMSSSSSSSLASRYSSVSCEEERSTERTDSRGASLAGTKFHGDAKTACTSEARMTDEYMVSFCEVYGTDAAGRGVTASLPVPSTAFWVAHLAHASREGMTMAAVMAEYVQRITALSHKIRLIK